MNPFFSFPGGDIIAVFQYLYDTQSGISGEHNYGYTGVKSNCKRKISFEGYYLEDYFYRKGRVPDETFLEICLNFYGPIAVGMYASENFLHYKSGIFANDGLCKPTIKINHVVVVVGYGVTDTGDKYW